MRMACLVMHAVSRSGVSLVLTLKSLSFVRIYILKKSWVFPLRIPHLNLLGCLREITIKKAKVEKFPKLHRYVFMYACIYLFQGTKSRVPRIYNSRWGSQRTSNTYNLKDNVSASALWTSVAG